MKFGEKLQKLRTEQNKTLKEVAAFCGITRQAYTAYERNNVYPRKRETYDKLAEFFGVDKSFLLNESEAFTAEAYAQYGSHGRKQAEELLAEMGGLFAGGELTDEDKDAVMIAMQKMYFDAKEDNKKYGRNKH